MGGKTGFSTGEEMSLHLREVDLLVYRQALLPINKGYFALISVIPNLQGCKNAAIHTGLDNREGLLGTRLSFPLKHRILPRPQQCLAECLAHNGHSSKRANIINMNLILQIRNLDITPDCPLFHAVLPPYPISPHMLSCLPSENICFPT